MNNQEMQDRIDYLEDRLLQERWQKSYDFKSVEEIPLDRPVLALVHGKWHEGEIFEYKGYKSKDFVTSEATYSLKYIQGWTELPDKP